ncbi:protein kinase family protein [Parendozoicomonas sp. Alg238-R29]|uniref:serine/threonine protein kinase n=1 Tax=Parendozoicomonas sp. Alg238-R29 TaxID=2993446 RepID=UPI00248EE184|nr:protein kinase family protein [Parendozoicomonas sp. Alg238-R29]
MQDKNITAQKDLAEAGFIAGRFMCGSPLAKTRYAQVYQGWDRHSGKSLILKKLIEPTPRKVAALRREGSLLQLQSHPGLISGKGYLNWHEQHWLVMNPAQGSLLLDLLKAGQVSSWSESLCRRVVTNLAEALNNLHDNGWIHGDLKPDNIFVDADKGSIQLIDFSATRLFGEEYTNPYYTPEWQHPEIGKDEADEQIDNYALGLLIWCLWTGGHPFARYQAVNFNKPPLPWPLKKGNWLSGFWLRHKLKTRKSLTLVDLEQRFGIGRMLKYQ